MPIDNKPSNIDKFTKYFDKDWRTCRSTLSKFRSDDKSYDPSNSWDGRSDNPQRFSRLTATEMPTQTKYPITMCGSTVVPLEPIDGLPIFNNFNNKTKSNIPLTTEQKDLNMSYNLKGEIPLIDEAKATNKVIYYDTMPSFKNMDMREPKFNIISVPQYINEVGNQCDQKLLTPLQRREILDFEVRTRAANEYIRKAVSDRIKTKKLISGIPFHRGVLGYDSTNNIESEAYGEKAKKLHEKLNKLDEFHEKRKEYIYNATGHLVNNTLTNAGYINPKEDTTFQSKGRVSNFDLSFNNTYNSIFGQIPYKTNPERTQNLRNQDHSGKLYNITQHTKIEYWPSEPFHRDENKILKHPSQACLEGQRNLQGTLLPHK